MWEHHSGPTRVLKYPGDWQDTRHLPLPHKRTTVGTTRSHTEELPVLASSGSPQAEDNHGTDGDTLLLRFGLSLFQKAVKTKACVCISSVVSKLSGFSREASTRGRRGCASTSHHPGRLPSPQDSSAPSHGYWQAISPPHPEELRGSASHRSLPRSPKHQTPAGGECCFTCA